MTDDLLPYYNRELAYIRRMGAEFAQANPKIAGRLRWAGDSTEDPHVSRLIEAFAFLTARIRRKVDDEFPEITESLLNVLYPHYLAPIPSSAIVQLQIDRSQGKLTAGYRVAKGSTVETEAIEGQPCRFRTAYDVKLWPIEVASISYQGQPFAAPAGTVPPQTEAVLRIKLRTYTPEARFHEMALESLRFHIYGQGQWIYDVYEMLMNHVTGVAVGASAGDPRSERLSGLPTAVGFEPDEGLCDYSARSFPGYRLLSEYFAFPEKFFFVDFPRLSPETLSRIGSQSEIELSVYLSRHDVTLERHVTREMLRLGCTPIVNLYKQRAEPIRWQQTESEYRIVPDARRPGAHEIYSIDRVVAMSPRREELEFTPFFSARHAFGNDQPRAFWHAARRRAGYAAGQVDRGTEMFLSLVDLDFQPASLSDWLVDVETTCLNRDLPSRLEFGGGRPHLQLSGGGPLGKIVCLTPPTPTYRPSLREGVYWRLISHLTLNHLSLLDTQRGAESLRELLRLYDPLDTQESRAVIDGVSDVRWRRTVGRVTGATAAGFCRGVEVTLQFDEDKYTGSGIFLLASVLERFFALYSSLNSFTQTVVTSRQRPGVVRRWAPRAGQQILV